MAFNWGRLEREDREKLARRSIIAWLIMLILAIVCGVEFAVGGEYRYLVAGLVWMVVGAALLLFEIRGRRRRAAIEVPKQSDQSDSSEGVVPDGHGHA